MAELSPLQRWLHFVDEQLSPEAVDFLKLGLHSEFFRYYREIEKLDKPSLVYYFLLEKCMRRSSSKALKMFLHVLHSLGGNLRGSHVIGEAFGVTSMYGVQDPGLFDIQKASVNFKFFQCLLKIAVKARKTALGEQLMKKFSKSRFLNINHRHVKNLSDLFVRLFQKQFISAANTHHLVDALYKYKAWLCLQILNTYHKSVGLQPIALVQSAGSDISSSDPATSMDESSDLLEDVQYGKSFYELDDIDQHNPVRLSYVCTLQDQAGEVRPEQQVESADEDEDTCIIESSETDKMISVRRRDAAEGQLGTNKVLVMSTEEAKRKSRRGYKLCSVILICLLVISLATAACLTLKVWMKLAPHHPIQVPILDGSAILLLEDSVDSLFHKTVSIDLGAAASLKNFDTDIGFFKVPGSCENIAETDLAYNKKPEQFHMTDKNISDFSPVYVLAGSKFDYQLASPANSSKYVDVCVFSGISRGEGRKICKKGLLREAGGQFTVPHAGYVYFGIKGDATEYSLTVNAADVTMLQVANDDYADCTLNATNTHCDVQLPLKPKSCIVAMFYHTTHGVSGVKLTVSVGDSRFGVMLVPPLLVIVIFLAVILVSFFLLCFCRIYSTHSSPVTIV